MSYIAMATASRQMASVIVMATKKFCIHHQVPRWCLNNSTAKQCRHLLGRITSFSDGAHIRDTRPYTTSAVPSAVGFDNYDDEVKNFKLPTPEYFNFATDVIDVWAEKQASTN